MVLVLALVVAYVETAAMLALLVDTPVALVAAAVETAAMLALF